MSERPATRADLRAGAWGILYSATSAPAGAEVGALRLLAALDAEEASDARGARFVARCLRHSVVETSTDGRRIRLRWREPEPVS